MIMSAIFIETFFSTCGACALADAETEGETSGGKKVLRDRPSTKR
jgi:hypothetical protein